MNSRVSIFDKALMSRIHIQNGYELLTNEACNKTWENSFRMLSEDLEEAERQIEYEYCTKEYVDRSKEVMELQWNGRKITDGRCEPQ